MGILCPKKGGHVMTNYYSTLEQLQHEYEEADLQPKHLELVKDEEVFFLLDESRPYWPWVFGILFIVSILISGMVGR